MIQFEPYLGKKFTKVSKHGLFFDVVNRLTYSLRGTNVRVYTDSAYSSCKTALFLMQKGIRMTSTVRWNSTGLHPFVKAPPKKMIRGTHKTFQDRNNPALTCTVWKDTAAVRFLSTETNPTVVSFALRRVGGAYVRINQPLVASKYADNYKSVDFFDFATTKYQLARRSYRSWLYLFSWSLQASIVNAYILFKATNTESRSKHFSQADFRLILGKQLINGFSCRKVKPTYEPLYVGPDITGTQILDHENSRLNSPRGRSCKYHRKRYGCNKRTVFGCRICQIYLCKECHFAWHDANKNNN